MQAHVLVGEAAESILAGGLCVHTGIAGKPRTPEWGRCRIVGSLEKQRWEEGQERRIRRRVGSKSVEASVTVQHRMNHC